MNKQINDMTPQEIENMPTLGLDDTFEFRCKACGKCCKNRTDVILTPYDLYRIAEFLGRTPAEIVERYCEVYEGRDSHFPIVRILPVAPDNSCPFLRNKKCAVHAKKPAVCRVYPLARLFGVEGESRYYYNGASCNHEPVKISVRRWIADIASDEAEQAGRLWMDIISTIYPLIHSFMLKGRPETHRHILDTVFVHLWLGYDMKKPFVTQISENVIELQEKLILRIREES